jgi:hypothetical protein
MVSTESVVVTHLSRVDSESELQLAFGLRNRDAFSGNY